MQQFKNKELFGSVSFLDSKVTWVLVTINVVMFIATSENFFVISETAIDTFGYKPIEDKLFNAFTSMFVHGSAIHLAFNMWALVQMGPAIEKHFGKTIYIAVFMGSGIAGTFLHSVTDPFSSMSAVGASGAIIGLFGMGMAIGDKFSRTILYWQIGMFIIATVFLQNEIEVPMFTNIGYMIHFGGFVFGYLVTRYLMKDYVIRAMSVRRLGKLDIYM